MKGTNSLKGSHSIKTMQSLRKDSETNSQQGPDFLKMYMLEKERTRLRSERTRLLLRLEPIEARLKEIDAYYVETLGLRLPAVQKKFRTVNRTRKRSNGKLLELIINTKRYHG
jgi:hypothetical protein